MQSPVCRLTVGKQKIQIAASPAQLLAGRAGLRSRAAVSRLVGRPDFEQGTLLLCPALPGPCLPCPALPCPALPALPCPALPCPALPCPALVSIWFAGLYAVCSRCLLGGVVNSGLMYRQHCHYFVSISVWVFTTAS